MLSAKPRYINLRPYSIRFIQVFKPRLQINSKNQLEKSKGTPNRTAPSIDVESTILTNHCLVMYMIITKEPLRLYIVLIYQEGSPFKKIYIKRAEVTLITTITHTGTHAPEFVQVYIEQEIC